MSGSSVAEFYNGRSVLITGATGFMGKVLVEKLLRSCSGVSKIYVLMRPKGPHDVSHRLQELLKSTLFDKIRGMSPDLLDKVVSVKGDIALPALGLSPADTALLAKNVSVVFHAAATVKFDEALKLSVQMNVLGTMRMVELCHKMEKLVALMHVSTAYCNCDRKEVEEVVYPSPMDPSHLIGLIDWMEDEDFSYLTPRLIGKRPNTYTFTKALAEHVLTREGSSLPITIVRPSIVCAAWREPLPGWVDNLNGATGLVVGAGKGFLRNLHCDPNLVADIIPVDIPINLLIVAAWYTSTHRSESVHVFNCVSGAEKPLKWGELRDFGMSSFKTSIAMNDVVWYPSLHMSKSKFLNSLYVIYKHWIPAYVIDFLSKMSGKKPIMLRIVQKMTRATACLEYFTTHEWTFSNENVQSLWRTLSEADQRNFNFSLSQIHWPTYMEQYCLGSKKYVMKEDLTTLPSAKCHLKRMWLLREVLRVVFVLIAWRMVLFQSPVARKAWASFLRMFLRTLTYFPLINRI